jgi:hypothetical protein
VGRANLIKAIAVAVMSARYAYRYRKRADTVFRDLQKVSSRMTP